MLTIFCLLSHSETVDVGRPLLGAGSPYAVTLKQFSWHGVSNEVQWLEYTNFATTLCYPSENTSVFGTEGKCGVQS